jgi:putative flippase GtrA
MFEKMLEACENLDQRLRFIGVGMVNTIVGYAIYAVLIWLNIPYLVALLLGTIMGVVFNYFSNGRFVFRSEGSSAIFIKYVVTYGVVYLVNATLLTVIIKAFQVGLYFGQGLCVPASVLLSWVLMKYWVYENE